MAIIATALAAQFLGTRLAGLPRDTDVPEFVQAKFADFNRDMFARQTEIENNRGVFLEYAWDMAWCDPCAADPLSPQELPSLGVFWTGKSGDNGRVAPPQAQSVFVTRLHVRYDRVLQTGP